MRIQGIHGSVEVSAPAARVLLVAYDGTDVGEFKDEPFRELDRRMGERDVFHLFVDGRGSQGASMDVSNAWARWLSEHRDRLASVHLLSASKVIQVSGGFVRRFARLEDKMRVHAAYEPFEAAFAAAVAEGPAR